MAGFFGVLVVASPSIKGGILESAGKTKGDWPGEGAVFNDGGEIGGGLFNGLSAREEDYAGEFFGDVVF